MLVLIQLVGWLDCGILAVLAFMLGYSNIFHDEKGDQPFIVTAIAFVVFIAATIGALVIYGAGENIRQELDRANTAQMIEDLRRAAKGY